MADEARAMLHALGQALCQAREATGETLHDLARQLRIKSTYLEAIEAGELGRIPGRAYALGFLRTYAERLGFDGEAVVSRARQALDRTAAPAPLHYRVPLAERARPGGAVVGLAIVTAALLYGGWHIHLRDEPVLTRVAAVPGELGRIAAGVFDAADRAGDDGRIELAALSTDGPAGSDASPPATAGAVPATSTAGLGGSAPGPAASAIAASGGEPDQDGPAGAVPALTATADAGPAEAPPPAAAAAVPSAAAVPPALATTAAPDSTSAAAHAVSPEELLAAIDRDQQAGGQAMGRVMLLAREPSWIRVRGAEADLIRSRTLEAGERLALPDEAGLALWTGNAGGLEVFVDGVSIGMLGGRGRVLRNVPMAPEQLRARLEVPAAPVQPLAEAPEG